MRYYYIHPQRPQYFFPKGFTKHPLFLTFFKPYSLFASISWFLFKNLSFYRYCFSISNIEEYIPEKNIRQLIGDDCLLAFNTGTVGPEQKITALGVYRGSEFFIKYAQTKQAICNVKNEYEVLTQLQLDFVPKVIGFNEDQTQIMLKTNVLPGLRLDELPLDENILERLFHLSRLDITVTKKSKTSLRTCFAHGDFCPWNMMTQRSKVLIFDWEMAGEYSLGYDLFTFMFQTMFLLQPDKTPDEILKNNAKMIIKYFNKFNIDVWHNYLIDFAKHKLEIEQRKGDKGMGTQYHNLLNYAQKL